MVSFVTDEPTVTDLAGKRRRQAPAMTRRRWFGLVLLATAIVVLLVIAWPRTSTYSTGSESGALTFEYPSGWAMHDRLPGSTGTGQVLALIGTMPWGPCAPSDINCHYQERFDRHEIEISVERGALMGSDFCSYARERPDLQGMTGDISVAETHYLRIDGRPAISTYYTLATTDYYLSDGWRKWEIAPVGTTQTLYRIFAQWRGPGDDEFTAALDRLVASMHFERAPNQDPPSADCGDPFPPLATLAPGVTPSPTPEPTPTALPEPQIDCTAEPGALPAMLASDPCPDAITAVELAVAPQRLPVSRMVIEPGPFYCDLVWPGGQTLSPCRPAAARPGQFMHGWVGFFGSDQVAAVVLGLDLPDDLDAPGATRPPWKVTIVADDVPPPGFVVQ
jgi:hypothetical protein